MASRRRTACSGRLGSYRLKAWPAFPARRKPSIAALRRHRRLRRAAGGRRSRLADDHGRRALRLAGRTEDEEHREHGTHEHHEQGAAVQVERRQRARRLEARRAVRRVTVVFTVWLRTALAGVDRRLVAGVTVHADDILPVGAVDLPVAGVLRCRARCRSPGRSITLLSFEAQQGDARLRFREHSLASAGFSGYAAAPLLQRQQGTCLQRRPRHDCQKIASRLRAEPGVPAAADGECPTGAHDQDGARGDEADDQPVLR